MVGSKLHLKAIRRSLPAGQRHHTRIVYQEIKGLPGVHPLREVGDRCEIGQIEMFIAYPGAGHLAADLLDSRLSLAIVATGQNDLRTGLETTCSRDQIASQAHGYFRISGICRLVGRFCSVSNPRPSILRAPQNSISPLRYTRSYSMKFVPAFRANGTKLFPNTLWGVFTTQALYPSEATLLRTSANPCTRGVT